MLVHVCLYVQHRSLQKLDLGFWYAQKLYLQPRLPSGRHVGDIQSPLSLLIRTVLPCHICKHTKPHAPTAITGWDPSDPQQQPPNPWILPLENS